MGLTKRINTSLEILVLCRIHSAHTQSEMPMNKPTLREFRNLIQSNLAHALLGSLYASIEALCELVCGLTQIQTANTGLQFHPAVHSV